MALQEIKAKYPLQKNNNHPRYIIGRMQALGHRNVCDIKDSPGSSSISPLYQSVCVLVQSCSSSFRYVSASVAVVPARNWLHKTLSVPFQQHEFIKRQGNREDLCSVLSRSGSFRDRKMWPSSLLPLLHQNESSLRPEVLRRLPRGAR